MNRPTRTEKEVFADLLAICRCPGYIHAIACLCLRDNVILYKGDMKEAEMRKMHSPSQLIRTEINTLLGLMVKSEIDWSLPAQTILYEYINTTEQLLGELHHCLQGEFWPGLTKEMVETGFNPFERGKALREPIFYSGESAYIFQYLDLAVHKYSADAQWLKANRGFTIDQAVCIAKAIEEFHTDHFASKVEHMRKQHPDKLTLLPFFAFTANEIAKRTHLDIELVELVLSAFELPTIERNEEFNALQDFNIITVSPLIRMPSGEFLLLQSYSLAEAIYEAPHYWMYQDKAYCPSLAKNRGDFVEHFIAERLILVFGNEHVHLNVNVFETKAKRISDIDVLVVWGNRVVIVQTKSKRLTLDARKGNDKVIRDDFKMAIQDAYDQGVRCAKCMLDKRYRFETKDTKNVSLPNDIKEIFIFCIVSDHYPALSFQVRQFLQSEFIDRVQAPLVMDIFFMDALTEMLQSPLQFLSFVNRRANYAKELMASQELTILGYHLKHNLWTQPDIDLMLLEDTFSYSLDNAMAVRRTGVQGAATPDGVLNLFEKTTVGRVIKDIEARPEPATIDLGFLLLSMSGQALINMSRVIDMLIASARAYSRYHDATFVFKKGCGIAFLFSDEPTHVAGPRLELHCELRKYKEMADEWFGLCMSSLGPEVRFYVYLVSPWIQDNKMDEKTKGMQVPETFDEALEAFISRRNLRKKIGRNDPCPCGSGRKYKKCCLINY